MEKERRLSQFIGAGSGIGFAIALLVGTAALNVPTVATDQELVAWYSDSGNRISSVVSMFAFFAAGALFLVFLGALLERMRLVEGSAGRFSWFTGAAGQMFAATLFFTGAVRGAIGKAVEFNDQPLPQAGVLRSLTEIASAALGVFAMLSAALVVGAVSLLVTRRGGFPRWLGWLGLACVVVLVLVQATFVAEIAVPVVLIWAVATSIQLRRNHDVRTAGAAHAGQAASFG